MKSLQSQYLHNFIWILLLAAREVQANFEQKTASGIASSDEIKLVSTAILGIVFDQQHSTV